MRRRGRACACADAGSADCPAGPRTTRKIPSSYKHYIVLQSARTLRRNIKNCKMQFLNLLMFLALFALVLLVHASLGCSQRSRYRGPRGHRRKLPALPEPARVLRSAYTPIVIKQHRYACMNDRVECGEDCNCTQRNSPCSPLPRT